MELYLNTLNSNIETMNERRMTDLKTDDGASHTSNNVPPPPNDFATGSAPYASDMIDASPENPTVDTHNVYFIPTHTRTHTRRAGDLRHPTL